MSARSWWRNSRLMATAFGPCLAALAFRNKWRMNMIGRNNETIEAYPNQMTAAQFIKKEFGVERFGTVTGTFTGAMSRRAFLRTSGALTVTAIGLSSGWNLFAEAGPAITPFTYRAPQKALDDLTQRLARTRWPERETVKDWTQGVPLAKLRALVEY
jgi:Epoxide hydrolase N terminus